MRSLLLLSTLPICLSITACKTVNSAADAVQSAGSTVVGAAGQVPSLVNVDLSNVLNNLALDLNIDKANIPINAQIPITIAANVCGVSINVLSLGAGGGSSQGCTAKGISPELKKYIQQQLAANGSVGGGAQTTQSAPATTGTATTTTGTTTSTTTTGTGTTSITTGTGDPTQPPQ
jgi:hypothetical protein